MKLFDVYGKEVRSFNVHSDTFTFDRKELSAGMYLYNIISDQKIIGAGKILIE